MLVYIYSYFCINTFLQYVNIYIFDDRIYIFCFEGDSFKKFNKSLNAHQYEQYYILHSPFLDSNQPVVSYD